MYKNLSDQELLKMLVRERECENIVKDLFSEFGTLDKIMAVSSIEELTKIQNIGVTRAGQIKAAFELGYRLYKMEYIKKETIRKPQDVVKIVNTDMRFLTKEHFKIILLNTKNQVMGIELISVGSLNASIVHPREVFNRAIKKSCAAVILLHNHPSGNPQPSKEDINITKRLIEVGKIIGIEVLDHVITGYGTSGYFSMKEENII